MADSPKRSERTLRRHFEPNRLEEELWALAYQQIRPVVRRSLECFEANAEEPIQEPTPTVPLAQGA